MSSTFGNNYDSRSQTYLELVVFFALAYSISWILWGILIAFHLSAAPGKSALGRALYFAGIQGPVAGAVIVSFWRGGTIGVKKLVARIVRPPFSWVWLAVAIFAFPAIYITATALAVNTGHAVWPHPLLVNPVMGWWGLIWGQLLIMFGEEYGWRGFALPRLERLVGTLGGAFILGVIWSLWHWVLFYTSGSWQSGSLAAYTVFTVASCIVQAMIFFRANQSVLAAMLYHGALNATQFTFDVPNATVSFMPYAWGIAVVISILLMPRPWFRWRAAS